MKTSFNQLQKYVKHTWSADELAEKLTMAGLEVEGREIIHDFPSSIVIARVISRNKHPNADKMSVCEVDDGSGSLLQVICGAPNCDAGNVVVLAKIGTKMGEDFVIKEAKIRGTISKGMLCSEKELGLGEGHSGILVLPAGTPVGQPFCELVKRDVIIDWEVTPNRPDWLSHIGIAREISCLAESPLSMPSIEFVEEPDSDINEWLSVRVDDEELCPRYTARVIRGVEVGPSPDWMQLFLRSIGLRPINNVVDITNYVLHECGQPLHAFDLKKVAGKTIVVRRALKGENLTTLDHEKIKLGPDHLVIADSEKGIALAGIIGGGNSEIESSTCDILLESASFGPSNVRATARHFGISTDSSYRFERGVDIDMVAYASARAAQLICDYAGGKLVNGVIDTLKEEIVPHQVKCRFSRVQQIIGISVNPSEIVSIFERLGLAIDSETKPECTVSIPSFRKDLVREIDLIEEIARIYGLDKIPATAAAVRSGGMRADDAYYPIQQIRNQLLSLGLHECVTDSLVTSNKLTENGSEAVADDVELMNPLSKELSVLRSSLLGGILDTAIRNNAHKNHDLRLFEIGNVFKKNGGEYQQHYEACILLSGRKNPERFSDDKLVFYDFYDLRGLIEDWMDQCRISGYTISKSEEGIFRKGCGAEISIGGITIGKLGEFEPACCGGLKIKHPLFVALFDVSKLLNLPTAPLVFTPLPQFPAITRDVTFSADEELEHHKVVNTIENVGVNNLAIIELMDIFRDEKIIGKNKKSMAYMLTFRSSERTLTDKEVNKAQEKIRLTLLDQLPIQIR